MSWLIVTDPALVDSIYRQNTPRITAWRVTHKLVLLKHRSLGVAVTAC